VTSLQETLWTMSTSTSSMSAATDTGLSGHQYLATFKADDIRSWSASIPAQQDDASNEELDPAVQAYLEAKMALFGSLTTATNT